MQLILFIPDFFSVGICLYCSCLVSSMGGSRGDVSENLCCKRSERRAGEWAVTWVKRRKGWAMSCDVGEVMENLENELCHFTYITAHSPTLLSLYLRHNSFFNPSIASPTSQLILQPFFRFSYTTGFHLRHLASHPWIQLGNKDVTFLLELKSGHNIPTYCLFFILTHKIDQVSEF